MGNEILEKYFELFDKQQSEYKNGCLKTVLLICVPG